MDGGDDREARLALGGVAHKPWRDREAEALLRGKAPPETNFAQARPTRSCATPGASAHNDFKIELAHARRSSARLDAGRRVEPQTHDDRTTSAQPINRVDGRAKVTGEAKYAAEYHAGAWSYGCGRLQHHRQGPDHAHRRERGAAARPACSRSSRTRTAPQPGAVRSQLPRRGRRRPARRSARSTTPRIQFSGQPVALVVADTLELARYAATLVRVEYETAGARHRPAANLARSADAERSSRAEADPRGDADKALAAAAVRSMPSTACRSSTTTRWRCSRRPWSGRGRHAHRLRQDPGRAERPQTTSATCSAFTRTTARRLALRRRGVRLGPAAAVPGRSWPCWRRAS